MPSHQFSITSCLTLSCWAFSLRNIEEATMKKEDARFMPEGSKYDLVVQSLSDFIDKATAVRDSLKEYGVRPLTKEEQTIIRCSLLPVIDAVQSEYECSIWREL